MSLSTRKAIFLVDDDPMVLASLRYQLHKKYENKYILCSCPDAEQALEDIEEYLKAGIKIVLIISDNNMPGIKGPQFLEIVSKKHKEENIKAIMITAHIDTEEMEKVLRYGTAIEILSKPWNPERIFRIIDSLDGE